MYNELFMYGANISLAGGDGTGAMSSEIIKVNDNDFEFIGLCHIATSNIIRMMIKDDNTGRTLGDGSNGRIDIRGISATALSGITSNGWMMARLERSLLIKAGSNLTVEAVDGSGNTNTFRIVLFGFKKLAGEHPFEIWKKANPSLKGQLAHWYSKRLSTAISASGSATLIFDIDSGSDFLVQALTGIRTGACTVRLKPPTGQDKIEWSNIAIHFDNVIGNSQFPHRLLSPKFLKRGSTLEVELTDLSGSSNNVEIILHGRKLYGKAV